MILLLVPLVPLFALVLLLGLER
ncbi:MAG: hypothetical protein QOG30_3206, partial [Acidimicrobiaceae bacterium]